MAYAGLRVKSLYNNFSVISLYTIIIKESCLLLESPFNADLIDIVWLYIINLKVMIV